MKQDTKDFHYSWYEIKRTGYAYSIRPLQGPPVRLKVPCTLRACGTARAPPARLIYHCMLVRKKLAKYDHANEETNTGESRIFPD